MNRIHDIDATLRSLDPADPHVDPVSARARSDLHAILATDPTSYPRRRPWPSTRRVVLVGGMVAAATVALVTLPSLTGGDQAFATWAAAPEGMSAQQRAEAATHCRKNQKDGAGAEYAGDLGALTIELIRAMCCFAEQTKLSDRHTESCYSVARKFAQR